LLMLGWVTAALLFIGPSYVANAAPLVFGGGRTLDGGRKLSDGQPIFGSHKTIRGVIVGILAGSAIGLAESPVDSRLVLAGFTIAIGAVSGDLLGAFVKRRFRIEPGRAFPVLDQLDFVLGGLLFGYPFFPLGLFSTLLVVMVTPPIHLATNYGAYRLGMKKTRW
jgi:CDP-2,3-bis-(O-geranylgeranyl)-sn-glycerol synthase